MRAILLLIAMTLGGCGWVIDDADYVKSRADRYYTERGFKVLGYQGYNIWVPGRCYWYTIQRGNTIYESCLMLWSGELHEYGLKAVDALKGTS